MKRKFRPWVQIALIFSLLVSLLPIQAAMAATSITITYPAPVPLNNTTGLPADTNTVQRLTLNPTTITATIQGVSSEQVPDIYYEITNVNTGITTTERNNKATYDGQFTITFQNVYLTEGLNKITVKLGESNATLSPPVFAYFTPATNITSFNINSQPFVNGQIYPSNPAQGTVLNMEVTAPNADGLQAYLLGSATPINAYQIPGTSNFAFIADDINKSNTTAHFRLTPGDNLINFIARNNTRTFTEEKNIIYDNGDPFAFNANIYEVNAAGAKQQPAMPLIGNPTVTTPKVAVEALIKNDIVPTGLEYNFVDVVIGDNRYGPYNLTGYTPAAQVQALAPTSLEIGGFGASNPSHLYLTGAGLQNSIQLVLRKGSDPAVTLNADASRSSDAVLVYALPSTSITATGTYTARAMSGTSALAEFTLTVTNDVTAAADQAVVTGTTLTTHTLGNTTDQTVTFSGGADLSNVRVDLYAFGQTSPRNTIQGSGTGTTITIPALALNTFTPGKYRMSVTQLSGGTYRPIWEQTFTIQQADPAAPSFTSVTPTAIPVLAQSVYINVNGSNLALGREDVSNPRLTDGTTTIPLTVHDASAGNIVFRLADASVGVPGTDYNLIFDLQRRYANGDPFGAPASVTASIGGSNAIVGFFDPTGAPYTGYANETVANVAVGNNLQLLRSETRGAQIRVTGTNLAASTTRFELEQASGAAVNIGFAPSTLNGSEIQSAFSGDIPAGYYILKVFSGPNLLTQYPISVAEPSIQSFTESVLPRDLPQILKVRGAYLGRNESSLHLEISKAGDSSFTPIRVAPVTGTLQGGNRVQFNLDSSNLREGTYQAQFVYNGTPVGTGTATFTISSPKPSLEEVASRSKAGQYKVFRFEATLDISPDKQQFAKFEFYNFEDDVRKPSNTFTFYYENPDLPYVDRAVRYLNGTTTIPMVDAASGYNEINEVPTTLGFYANPNTQKLNVYYDSYTPSKDPELGTLETYDEVTLDGKPYRLFRLDLTDMTQGRKKLIVVPIDTDDAKNYGGRKEYEIQVSSAPYIILDNIYNGLVVDSINKIGCGLTVPCVTGRLVNVPTDGDFGNDAGYRVEVIVNDKVRKIGNTDFPDGVTSADYTGRLQIPFNSGELSGSNGKITFKFIIYRDNVKMTESIVEVFVFSENVPEFISIRPIETTDTPKYIQAGAGGSAFVTNESTVAFQGQFANANEIKLTVRGQDADGRAFTKTDRRYDNFRNREQSHEALFNQLNTSTFTTNQIALTPTGDTVFEFTITDDSGVVIVRTITITREPLPYVIKYPILVKNSRGQDQANVNGNYSQIVMEAEGADSVMFGKEEAVKRIETENGVAYTRFYYEAKNLKAGANTIKFTVARGQEELDGSFIIFNSNTPIEGALFKSPLKTSLKAFDGLVELKFPRGTTLRRNDPSAVNQFLTSDRELVFGIASSDGRIDKYRFPFPSDGQFDNPNDFVSEAGKVWLTEPTGRFRPASKLVWIDAGTITGNQQDLDLSDALSGSGREPYEGVPFYTRAVKDLVVPTQPGTLTIKYDPSIRNDAWKYLTVYHFDIFENAQGVVQPRWRNIGGVVDTGKNTITVPVERFGYYQVMYMSQSYDDVIGHEWARNDLDIMYSKGMMLNQETNAFVANTPISRGEFTTLLVKIFDIPLQYSETPTFTDVLRYSVVANPLYDYKYIETAARVGIIRGSGGGRFQPDSAISRQDAAVMIARAANLKTNTDAGRVLQALQKEFTDANQIQIYAQPSVEAIVKKGFIAGKENVLLTGQSKPTYRFDPEATFTRAEAAAVAIRILRDQKKIPK